MMDDKFAVPAPPGRSSTAAGPPVGVQVSGRDWQLLTIFELAKILVTEDDQETLLNQFLPSLIERLDAADAGSLWLVHAPDGRLCDTTVAVQGYGNVGSAAATILQEMGSTIVAMSDAGGRRYCPGGLDTTSLNEHVAHHPKGLLEGYNAPGVEPITNEELVRTDVDVLAPAALEHAIRADDAGHVRARMIVEGANSPTTPEADEILNDRGIVVVPDILANAGGIVVSYCEWVQDLQNFFWEEEEVNSRLERIMVHSFREM